MYIDYQENTYLHSYCFEAPKEETTDQIDFSIFSGNLQHDDHDDARNSWKISEGNNFKVRSKTFCQDKSKVLNSSPVFLIYIHAFQRKYCSLFA